MSPAVVYVDDVDKVFSRTKKKKQQKPKIISRPGEPAQDADPSGTFCTTVDAIVTIYCRGKKENNSRGCVIS